MYVVKPDIRTGRERTLHRNLLLPYSMLIDAVAEEELPNHKRNACTPKRKEPEVMDHCIDDTDSEEHRMFLPVFQP